MNKVYRILLQILNYTVFMWLVWYFSFSPPYHQLSDEQALITFTLGHVGKHVSECKRLTQEELMKLPPNMRKPMDCTRERSPIVIEMKLDDRIVFSKIAPPHGLYKDQGVDIYESIKVPVGSHDLKVWLNDDVKIDGPIYTYTQPIKLEPQQHMIVQFVSNSRSFKVN